MILCVLKRILLVLWKHFRTPCRKKCLITNRNITKVSTSLGFNFFVSESLLSLPPGLPLEFLHLEQQMMSYSSVHARGTQWVKRASAHTADLGVQFLCFWVTLGIASRSPFGIFAIGEATDELQVCARSNRWARARTDMLEGRFFQHLIGTWISLNIFGGLRLKKKWFEHSFASYRAVHVVGASVLAGA